MKLVWRMIWEWAVLLLFVFVLLEYDLVLYGIGAAKGELGIIWNSRPIAVALQDPAFPDSLKARLKLVEEIKQFAIDSLGLKNSTNYSTVFDQKGMPLLKVLTASDAYRLKPYQWHYLFLGAMPYKGFFDFDKAKKEAEMMKKHGFDVDLGEVSAWSTLGWFKDPILSGMLVRSVGYLANVVIHEMTHATLYVKDNVDYNENLANFIGSKGAELFLASKYGTSHLDYLLYKTKNFDDSLFSDYMVEGCNRLDSLYKSMKEPITKAVKDSAKQVMIRSILSGITNLPVHDTTTYYRISRRHKLPNNAWFLQFRRYNAKQNMFEHDFHYLFKDHFKLYLTHLKQTYKTL